MGKVPSSEGQGAMCQAPALQGYSHTGGEQGTPWARCWLCSLGMGPGSLALLQVLPW